jgi:hypothetical protein
MRFRESTAAPPAANAAGPPAPPAANAAGPVAGSGWDGNLTYSPPAPTPASAAALDPVPGHDLRTYTLGDLAMGKSQHTFNTNVARVALLTTPVSLIQGVQGILDGTSSADQTTKTYQQLAQFAKAKDVDLVFANQAKVADVIATDNGNIYLKNQGWQLSFPMNSENKVIPDELERIKTLTENISAMIDDSNLDVTPSDQALWVETPYLQTKKAGKVYASTNPFQVRHLNNDNKPVTTEYSSAIAKMSRELGGGYLMTAKRS